MKLEPVLDEFGLLLRRRRPGEEGQRSAAALGALREYLLDYSGARDTAAVTARELLHFLLDYYPAQEEPDPEVAGQLLEVCAGLAAWLVERDERTAAPFLEAAERLREDLPRALAALGALREHTDRDSLGPPVPLQAGEEGDEQVGAVGSGVDRVARLDEVDYAAGETDYFTVTGVGDGFVVLESASQAALGEPPRGPVRVPAGAASLLRPGDVLHAEVAPGRAGWELLELFGVRPAGYPASPR